MAVVVAGAWVMGMVWRCYAAGCAVEFTLWLSVLKERGLPFSSGVRRSVVIAAGCLPVVNQAKLKPGAARCLSFLLVRKHGLF